LEQIPRNLSNLDRAIRIGLGLTLLLACLLRWADGHLAIALFLFAWVPVITGIAGWCPVYQLFGISSRRR
jgi:hypothetical protein